MSDSSLIVAELLRLGGALAEPAPGADSAAETSEALDNLIGSMRASKTPHQFSTFAERDCRLSDCFVPADVERLRYLTQTFDPHGLFVLLQPLD